MLWFSMNKVVFGFLATGVGGALALGIVAARYEPTVRPNTYVGPVAVGGLTPEEAARNIRVWWNTQRLQKLTLTLQIPESDKEPKTLAEMTPGELGFVVDDTSIVKQLPSQDMVAKAETAVTSQTFQRLDVKPTFRQLPVDYKPLVLKAKELLPLPTPAKVSYVKGAILKHKEGLASELDREELPKRIATVLNTWGDAEITKVVAVPIKSAPKHVSDAAIDQLQEVVSTFTTHFSAGNRTRSTNIRLAAAKLNGAIVMPGEKLSFNQTVGRRTVEGGFQIAGVYKNGKHDTDIGGGICQVSTTMYNAAVLADLKIAQRSNHSLPVPYVPLGRDATVDYGSRDLVILNSGTTAIALSSEYRPGTLTFRILGTKDQTLSVKLERGPVKSWDRGVEKIIDPTLPLGKKKIVDRGGKGHSVTTYRLVYRNGALVSKERLNNSYYLGAPTIIAVGSKQPKPGQVRSQTTLAPRNTVSAPAPVNYPPSHGAYAPRG